MPVTAADLEEEYQEEQAKRAKAKANVDHVLHESFIMTRACRFVLVGGLTCAVLLFLVPWPASLPHAGDPIYDNRPVANAYAQQPPAMPKEPVVESLTDSQSTEMDQEAPFVEKTSEASDAPKIDRMEAVEVNVPNSIWDLAVQLLGEADATKFIHASVCTVKSHKQVKLGFWHNSDDRLDFNDGYNFDELKRMPSGSLAVDVGANLGDTAVLIHTENPRLRVVSLEPSPHNYIYVRWNMLHNKVVELTEADFSLGKPGVLALWGGATKDGRKIELAFSPQHTKLAQMKSSDMGFGFEVPPSIDSSGKHQLEKRYAGDWKTFTVQSFALVEWFRRHSVSSIKWFKLDCEGCEYETLIDLENSGLLQGASVMGEAHYRHVPDLSCKFRPEEHTCKSMISQMHQTRKLMCGKYKFSCCAKMMHCDLFQEKCTPKR